MASKFVSGGTSEQPVERNALWLKAEEELEVARRRKEEQRTHDGKSLYEALQENKAAKQDAFEESIRLKNQFRSLDETDVSFLNAVREAEWVKEQAIHKETTNKLSAFRRQQQELDVGNRETTIESQHVQALNAPNEDSSWLLRPKKRKSEKDAIVSNKTKLSKVLHDDVNSCTEFGSKDRLNSRASQQKAPHATGTKARTSARIPQAVSSAMTGMALQAPNMKSVVSKEASKLGLVGYSSDED